ncbi:rhodopsin-like [Exaiptasia diaphana]|uniref:G-protein coupled receptors family 1 profile domain-containing protein n=1 Tax=Exaiptasia diaphana TaxID=2652724 RepID=A0A913XR73_EXADI|nr:rhodopsin-like [Exaiptasia diaphana]
MEERSLTALAVIWIVAITTSTPFLFSVTMRTVSMEFVSSDVHGVITVKMSIHHGSDTISYRTTNITNKIQAKLLRKTVDLGNGSGVMSLNSTGSAKCMLPMQVCDIPDNIKGQASCVVFFVLSFVVPLLVISFAYIKIVQRLWLRCQATDDQGTAAKATLRAVRMLVLVVLAFLLTDGPWTVGCLVYSFQPRGLMSLQSHFTAVAIVTTLFYASAVITPTIHAIHSSTVQKEIVAIVCCRFRDKSFSSSTSSLLSTKRYSSIHFAKKHDKLTQGSENA